MLSRIAFLTSSSVGLILIIASVLHCDIAVSGVLKTMTRQSVQTTLDPSGIFPDSMSFKAPATEIAEAGSQKDSLFFGQ